MSNAILLVADCLRYDSAGPSFLSNYPWDRFERHYAVGNVSDVNFLSIFTGKTPTETSVRFMVDPDWDCPWITLPEILQNVGYRTFGSGWHWDYQERGCHYWHHIGPNNPGEEQVEGFWKWLGREEQREGRKWFAFIRTVDCHHEYTNGSYENAVRYTEDLFDALIETVLAGHPDTVLVVTADHGEDLAQHGIKMHSAGLWETLVHVPLLILRPQAEIAQRWSGLTQHEQLFRAILDMAGVGALAGSNNQSLYPLQHRETLYFDSEGQYPRVGVCRQLGSVSEQYKYWKRIAPNGQVKEYLYDLSADPTESDNLVDSLGSQPNRGFIPSAIGRIRTALRGPGHGVQHLKTLRDARERVSSVFPEAGYTEEEAKEVIDRLRGIGYVP